MSDTPNHVEQAQAELWEWLKNTPALWFFASASIISVPLSILGQFGWTWFLVLLACAATLWWLSGRQFVYAPPEEGQTKRKHAYTGKNRWGWFLLPFVLWVALAILLFFDISSLDVWRRPYGSPFLRPQRYGSVTKYFGDTAPRTTAVEREDFNRAEWCRLMERGVKAKDPGNELLFIETAAFGHKHHTLVLEVHDLSHSVQPAGALGSAFLVSNPSGDTWNRPKLRQVTCEAAGDFNSRLYRVVVETPNSGESLWLLLPVKPATQSATLDTINLQLIAHP